MRYVYGYLAIGVAMLLGFYVVGRVKKRPPPSGFVEPISSPDPPPRNRLERVLLGAVAPAVTLTLIVVAWPVVALLRLRQALVPEDEVFETEEARAASNPPREFAVAREHLVEHLSIEAIERRERVEDPFDAVPDLPFGHLNAAWRKFAEGVAKDDELWSFTAHWDAGWGRREIRRGYVVMRGGQLGAYQLTEWKKLESDSANPGGD